MLKKILQVVTGCAAVIFLASCPAPIVQEMLDHVTDELPPAITILSPDDDSYCAKSVIVSGTVSDLSTLSDTPGKVSSLSYEILSSTTAGDIEMSDDGSFSFEFSTGSLGSNFVVKITAADWNGNTAEASLSLLKLDGNDIPSFAAVPGAGEVRLSWDNVPGTSSYDLYYTTDGSTPSENYGELSAGITSPHMLSGLDNGSMHIFQLRARTELSSGEDSWSGLIRTIPLSAETLTPTVIPEAGKLSLSWPEIPATDTFEIWRSRQQDGSYMQIDSNRIGNTFVDRQASGTGGYFYKIKPSLENSPVSAPGFGAPSIFQTAPAIVNTIAAADMAYGTAVSGDLLFIADRSNELKIMDISSRGAPVLLKSIDLPGDSDSQYAFNVAVAGGYAYVANGSEGMQIVDIDPVASASVVGQVKKDSALESARDVAIDSVNGYAYVSDYFFGLLIIDISDIASAGIIKEIGEVDYSTSVVVSGDYVFAGTISGTAGVDVVSLVSAADPSGAVYSNTISTTKANDVYVSGDTLYVADATSGLRIYNITDPTADPPVLIETINTPDNALGVTVHGGFAYVADEQAGLQIINIASTRSPLNNYIKTYVDTNGARNTSVSGDYAYVADSGGGTRVIEISNPSGASTLINDTEAGSPWAVEVMGNTAYIADSATGLKILDISNPLSPSTIATVTTPGEARDVSLHGNYAYIADWKNGIQVIDISEPSDASIVNSLTTDGWTDTIKTFGNFLYAGVYTAGVQIFDISEPESAFSVKTVGLDIQCTDIALSGNYLFAGDGASLNAAGVKVIDIEYPSAATIVHTLFDGAPPMYEGTALSVSVHDRYLYVGVTLVDNDDASVWDNSLLVYDISDPEVTDQVAYAFPLLNLTGTYDIHISGGYAYLSTANYGLQIVDIGNLAKGGFITRVEVAASGAIYDSFVVDDYAFCAAGADGLQIIDLLPW